MIKEDDDLLVSGTATSGILIDDKYVSELKCTVATVSNDGFIKVWPDQQASWHNGKLWFDTNADDFKYKEQNENS